MKADAPVRRVLTVHWALRIFGPLPIAEVCKRTGTRDRQAVKDELCRLIRGGLVEVVLEGVLYDVTEDGRLALEHAPRVRPFSWW
jgi:hypothetical protein